MTNNEKIIYNEADNVYHCNNKIKKNPPKCPECKQKMIYDKEEKVYYCSDCF